MWGGPNRQYAAKKLFVYTLAGGLATLLGVISLVSALNQNLLDDNNDLPVTFSIPELITVSHDTQVGLNKKFSKPKLIKIY